MWTCVKCAFTTIVTRLRYLLRSSSPKLPTVFAFTSIVSIHVVLVQSRLLSFVPWKCVYNYCNCFCDICQRFPLQTHDHFFAFTSIVSPHAAFVNARLLLDAGPKCVYNYRISVAIVVKATVPLSARDIVVYNHCIYSFL